MEFKKILSETDQFAKHVGIELLEVEAGYAKAKMEISAIHLNGAKTVQGGAIFTLADLAFAAAANSHGRISVGVNVSITYMKSVASGILFAEAHEVSRNHKLAHYTVNIYDQQQATVAMFQGTAYRKEEQW